MAAAALAVLMTAPSTGCKGTPRKGSEAAPTGEAAGPAAGTVAGPVAGTAAEKAAARDSAATAPPKTASKRGAARPVLPALPDDVVATVNGEPISRADFDTLYQPGATQLLKRRKDGIVPDAYQASHRIKYIDQLVWSRLLALEAARTGVDYDPEALAKLEREERTDIADWSAHLARVGQTETLRRKLNVDHLREEALLVAAAGPLDPTEAELRAAYEATPERFQAADTMVRASHLLLAYGPRDPGQKILPASKPDRDAASSETLAAWEDASYQRAQSLRAKVMAPDVDFNEFAKIYSEGPGAFRGGDMGLFPKNRMVKAYAEAAFALDVGAVSEPVKSDKGYYVIKLFGRYAPGPLPFEAVRADLFRQVRADKYRTARTALKSALEARFEVVSEPLESAQRYRDAARGRARTQPARRVPEGSAAKQASPTKQTD